MKGKSVWALGCMSGTSLDGVDAAMIRTDGHSILDIGDTAYRPYSDSERAVLTAALGQWPGADLDEALALVQTAHAEIIAGFEGVDLVGFHGQTLAHEPKGRGTHQLGDGTALARATGHPVVWDFRSADVGMGGEGAPLAPYYHHAAARWAGLEAPVCFVNLGGVGNITWVDPACARPDAPEAVLAFDTGPANAPVNDLMQARRGEPYDAEGQLAASGTVDDAVVGRFLEAAYFFKMPPKSLDRNDFPDLLSSVADLSDADAAATLTACAAAALAAGLELVPSRPERLLLCGGGRKNSYLKHLIEAYSSCRCDAVESLGLDGDMVEAQAFGFLAVRVVNGLPTSGPSTTGVPAAIGGGVLSMPDG